MGLNLSTIGQKLFEQSVVAGVLFAGLIGFAWWARKQIEDMRKDAKAALDAERLSHQETLKAEREDKNRCYEMHQALQQTIHNNTAVMHEIKGLVRGGP